MSYARCVRRAIALLLLVIFLGPGLWWRVQPLPRLPNRIVDLRFQNLRIPPPRSQPADLRPFVLEKAWRLESRNGGFGGYSSLIPLRDGELLAISDQGVLLRFSVPGTSYRKPIIAPVFPPKSWQGPGRDLESSTADFGSNTVWIGSEGENAITRFSLSQGGLEPNGFVRPRGMSDWAINTGAESLLRLHDGRFLVLCECYSGFLERRRHDALLFPTDPLKNPNGKEFTMVGPAGFRPTDAAQLPDGRVLVLFRRLDWPMPARFSIRLAIGDPGRIAAGREWPLKQVAALPEGLPIDNFEGLAVTPRRDGKLTVWLISDDNRAVFQATYLWKLSLDPADLPAPGKKARGTSAHLSKSPG